MFEIQLRRALTDAERYVEDPSVRIGLEGTMWVVQLEKQVVRHADLQQALREASRRLAQDKETADDVKGAINRLPR